MFIEEILLLNVIFLTMYPCSFMEFRLCELGEFGTFCDICHLILTAFTNSNFRLVFYDAQDFTS